MYLTREQELALEGEYGEGFAKCMNILVKVGDVYNADKLIPVESVQVAGVSYLTVGDAIFSLFHLLENSSLKVKVPTWLNPCGMDTIRWQEMNISPNFAFKQLKILEFYKKLDVEVTLTCTPYLIGLKPTFASHIAWSESSAVVMANSFFGARTNREGAPTALASAITGLTPNYGLHLDESREPSVEVKINTELHNFADYSALGYWYGETFGNKIPIFTNLRTLSVSAAKAISAAIAAIGSVGLFHVDHITPESKFLFKTKIEERVNFTQEDKVVFLNRFKSRQENVELVTIGCPHASIHELATILRLLSNRRIKDGIKLWIFISRKLRDSYYGKALVEKLERQGVKIYSDTCMVVSPAIREQFSNIVTNSLKALFYLRQSTSANISFFSIREILEFITEEN